MKKMLLLLAMLILGSSPVFAITEPTAAQVKTNCSTWSKNLNCTMTNQQLVDNAVDQLTGGGGSFTFTQSLVNSGGTVTLLNDQTSPGVSTYYGTDSGGNKGWFTLGSGSGSVTSVGMTGDGVIFNSTVTGSPITTSGTLVPALLTQSSNTILAGPSSGSSAAPTFRNLIGNDLPNPSATTLGGIESIAPTTHQWINTISTSGIPSTTQPAYTDISGSVPALTALTGDGTASGTGSQPLTLATVNANVGAFTSANITVNAKGLITAASNGSGGVGGSAATYVVCASNKTAPWHCDFTATSTNAQTAINQAIVAANALPTGGHVLLTEGTFSIGTNGVGITPLSNVWLQGSGMMGITNVVGQIGLYPNAIVYTPSTISNFMITDMKIDGTPYRSATWGVQEKAISISSSSNTHIKVEHIWAYNTPASCINPDANNDVVVSDNIMEQCGTLADGGEGTGNNGLGFGDGSNTANTVRNVIASNNICINVVDTCILLEAQSGSTVATQNFSVTGNVSLGGLHGISSSGFTNVAITGNAVNQATGAGIIVKANTFVSIPFSNITVTGNTVFNGTGDGIDILDSLAAGGAKGSNVIVLGNTIDSNTGYGIESQTASNSIFSTNTISNNGLDGIYWLTGISLSGLKIIGNSIYNNGTLSTATHQSGISVKVNSTFTLSDLDIESNRISHNTGYAIDTELSAGAFSNFSLKNNDLTGNTIGATNLTGATFTPGTNFFPFGNRGYTTNNILEGVLNVTGNVGIGSITPGQALDVQGTVRSLGFTQTGTSANTFTGTPTFSNGTFSALFTGGNVGIGSITPGTSLDVQGTLRAIGGLFTNGNVGINSATPGQKLDVLGTVRMTGFQMNSGSSLNGKVLTSDASGNGTWAAGGGGGVSSITGDGLLLGNSASTGAVTLTNATQTANTVIGATGTTLAGLTVPSCSTGASALTWTSGTGFGCNTISGSGTVNSGTSGQAAYYATSTTAVSGTSDLIFNGLNVGIGSATPGQLLDVQGTIRSIGLVTTASNVGISTVNPQALLTVGTTGIFQVSNNGSLVTITSVLSGTHALNISTNSQTSGNSVDIASSASTSGDLLAVTSSSGSATGTVLAVTAGSTNQAAAVFSTGNVGIGTTIPKARFEVGSGKFDVLIGGNVGVNSTTPGQALDVQGTVRATNLSNSAAQTVVSCSSSGTVTFSQPEQGTSFKEAVFYANACIGTASYTYPVAFTNAPTAIGLESSLVSSNTASSCTVTGTTSTGNAILVGY